MKKYTITIKILEDNKIVEKILTYNDNIPLYSKGGELYNKILLNGIWYPKNI